MWGLRASHVPLRERCTLPTQVLATLLLLSAVIGSLTAPPPRRSSICLADAYPLADGTTLTHDYYRGCAWIDPWGHLAPVGSDGRPLAPSRYGE